MVVRNIKVKNRTGIHARPASLIVDTVSSYDAEVKIIHDNQEADAESIMGVMSLAISKDATITIKAEGKDAQKAVEEVINLIEDRFGEEE